MTAKTFVSIGSSYFGWFLKLYFGLQIFTRDISCKYSFLLINEDPFQNLVCKM